MTFKFRWRNVENERILLSIKHDRAARNVWSNGEEFPRWSEFGFRGELMRLTDYCNSKKEHERKRLGNFASIGWKSATQETLALLWDAAQKRIPVARIYDLL